MARPTPSPADRVAEVLDADELGALLASAVQNARALDAEARTAEAEAEAAEERLRAGGLRRGDTAGAKIVRAPGSLAVAEGPTASELRDKVKGARARAADARAAAEAQRRELEDIKLQRKRAVLGNPAIRAAVADAVDALVEPLRALARAQAALDALGDLLDRHDVSPLSFQMPGVPLSPERKDGSDGLSHVERLEAWLRTFRAAKGL